MIEWSIESPDTLAERNGLCAARLFCHLLTKHRDFLKGLEGWATTKLQSIAVESVVGYDTSDNVIDGMGDASVDNLPTMEAKNPYSMEEHSVSSGEGSEKKQQPSLGDDIDVEINFVEGMANNKGGKLNNQSQKPIKNVADMAAEEEMPAKHSVSSAEDGKEKLEESVDDENVVIGLQKNEPTNQLMESLEPTLTEASKKGELTWVNGLPTTREANLCHNPSSQLAM